MFPCAAATSDFAASAAARAASACATAASNCCCEISSFWTRPRSRSTSRAVLTAVASFSRWCACAETRFACATWISCSAPDTPASACCTPPEAVLTPDAVSTLAIGTPVRAAEAVATASASSAFARSTAIWSSRGSISTSTSPAFTAWLLVTSTFATVPPTLGAICVICPSTCASSVVSLPRDRSQKNPAIRNNTTTTTAPIRQRPPLPPSALSFLIVSAGLSSAIYFTPPRYVVTAASAMPNARAREALARLWL